MADQVIGFNRVKRIGSVFVDCFVSETITLNQELTSHVTDDQAPITDHVIKRPIEFAVEGILSETPLLGAVKNAVNQFYKTEFIGPEPQAIETDEEQRLSIARQKIRTLMTYYTEASEINIDTGLFKLEKYVMVSLTVPRTIQNGRNVYFSARFEKPRRASIDIVEREFSNAQVERVKPKRDVGTKDVENATDEQADSLKDKNLTSANKLKEYLINLVTGGG